MVNSMCGRYSLTCRDEAELRMRLGFDAFSETRIQVQPRYNLAPGQRAPVLRSGEGGPQIESCTWGFARERGGLHVNARVESAHRSEAFRAAFENGRCVIPADGFFEWRKEGQVNQPYWFYREDGELLLMAGLVEGGRYVVLTRDATDDVRDIHNRMPCVLDAKQALQWLDTAEIGEPVRLLKRAVSTRVNRADHDDEECIEPSKQGTFEF